MAHFQIQNLTFSYPGSEKKVLNNVSLEIPQGQYVALCGKSGSGKTTLLRHLKTVLTPYGQRTGRILLDGEDLEQVSHREQSALVGFVMQNPDYQIVTDKVWHELAFGLESLGCDQRTIRLRVAEMASYFGIQDWFHRNVSELSGGQKQLLNLASIMAMQPKVLVLDEPTSQLDPIAASDFLNTVSKINRELGTTILLSEHRLEDVLPAADRVVVLEGGRVLADAAPRQVGAMLQQQNHDLLCAMPSPMQIFYGTGSAGECPLTVRDGRTWLSREFEGKPLRRSQLPAGAEYAEPNSPTIELREVWFRYEKDAPDVLKGTCLKVSPGTLHAVVGGNGTGKSTMLKVLSAAVKPYRGRVLLGGKPLDKIPQKQLFRENVAMLPQDPQSLFVKKTVREELEEMLPGLSREAVQTQVLVVAEKCGVEHFLASHPFDLSGGEQQRCALAKVLLCDPKILLLDEPTKGIDNFFKLRLAKLLRTLCAEGVTILMVSHDVEFCAKYADHVSMFFDGGVITTNTPNRFFAENNFYTTAANRMSRHIFTNAVNNDGVIQLWHSNKRPESVGADSLPI